ncbi:ATP-binding protein [Iningainema tapete]|uniref:Circadian input-output histidine kinase CikA n=1 Tax=Iningainema tapete BLCC-T55 TaxID=2748662 RepID=A0A8J6XA83_9CYAN|nr:ATP-binding protein [Iningainema tapete]MBD2771005.1 response regulator [Iningainema tapete BLCC-T55]
MIQLLAKVGFTIPNPGALYNVTTTYAAFKGGLSCGLISAAFTIINALIFFSIPGHLFHYTPENLKRNLITILTSPVLAIMVGSLKQREERLVRSHAQAMAYEQSEAEIRKLNAQLEIRVAKRTAQLKAINKQLEQAWSALAQSEERYRFLGESVPEIIWTANPDGWTDYFNQRWVNYTGMTLTQSQGWDWKLVVHPDDWQRCVEIWTNSLQTGQAYEIEYRFKRASDGVYRWHLGRALPMRDASGKIIKWFGSCTDIDDQKRAEAALQKQAEQLTQTNRMKDEFLAVLSHELRSPLNAILGWLVILRTRKLDAARTAQAMETIERNARTQAQLVEDLLDVSRIIQGQMRLKVEAVDLIYVIKAAIDTTRTAAEAKNIEVRSLLEEDAEHVIGDRVRLQQIVWNLLSNAIKFTPEQGSVKIQLERVESHVQITVTDTGIGISPEFLPYVFDRFRQADSSTTRSHSGLGLGLAIVRHLVELHGGTVSASSLGVGQGATFSVKLSKHQVPQAKQNLKLVQDTPKSKKSCNCGQELENLRILVVDDEADARELVAQVLEGCGALVTTVDDGNAAIAALIEQSDLKSFDVLISDIGMPQENGYALLHRVRALEPRQGGRIPAVALTAYAKTEDRLAALQAGFQFHVTKPVEPAELIAVITELAGKTG